MRLIPGAIIKLSSGNLYVVKSIDGIYMSVRSVKVVDKHAFSSAADFDYFEVSCPHTIIGYFNVHKISRFYS